MNALAQLLAALLSARAPDAAAAAPPAAAPSAAALLAAQEAPPEYPQWTGALTVGATWSAGNTESTTLNANFNAVRRAEKDRWTFDAFSNYGQTDPGSIETANNHGGGAKYDYFASKKMYVFGNGSGKVDHVATLDLRTILGAGVGYQWKESDKLKWGTEAGLAHVDEDFEVNSSDESFLSARLASILAYKFSETAAFEQTAELMPSLEDSEDLLAKVDSRLKFKITGKWIAQIQYVLDYDGSTPNFVEEADHRVVLGLGWSLGT